jgi:hypothetical protein
MTWGRQLLALFFLLFFCSLAFGQYPTAWSNYQDFGQYGTEYTRDIANCPGGGYYVSSTDRTVTWDGILRKIDSTGNVLWTRNLPGGFGPLVADNTGVTVLGNVSNLGLKGCWLKVSKYDPTGKFLWNRRVEEGEGISAVQGSLDPSGNVVCTCYVQQDYNTVESDGVVLKLNGSSGATIFDKHYGIQVLYPNFGGGFSDSAGNTYAGGLTDTNAFVRKFDTSGALQWTWAYHGALKGFIADAAGNSYPIVSTPDTTSLSIFKVDPSGKSSWVALLGGPPSYSALTSFGPNGDLFVAWEDLSVNIQARRVSTSSGQVQDYGHASGRFDFFPTRIAIDSAGSIYVPAQTNDATSVLADGMLAKFTASGVSWVNRQGGSANQPDWAQSVIVDPAGHIALLSSVVNVSPLGYDARVTTFDTNGNIIWNEDYDPKLTGDGIGQALTDSAGNTYAMSGGDAGNPNHLTKIDANGNLVWKKTLDLSPTGLPWIRPQFTPQGNVVFLARDDEVTEIGSLFMYSPAGNLVGQHNMASPTDRTYDMKVGPDGSIYLLATHYTKTASGTTYNARVTKLDSTGKTLWIYDKPVVSSSEYVYHMAIDASGNIFAGFKGQKPSLAKISSAGTLLWQESLPPDTSQYLGDVQMDSSGNVIVVVSDQLDYSRTFDKLDPDGNILYSTLVLPDAQGGNEVPFALDKLGEVFTTGSATINNQGALKVVRVSPSGSIDWTSTYPFTWEGSFPQVLANNAGGAYIMAASLNIDDLDYCVVKVQGDGSFPWPSSGGAFRNHSLIFNPWGMDDYPSTLTTDARGNLYVGGSAPAPNGTWDAHLIKYWSNWSSFSSQNIPNKMTAGQTYTVSATFTNVGFNTWTNDGYKLAIFSGSDWGIPSTPVVSPVGPGEQVKFSFRVYAPTVPGVYNLSTQMYDHTVAFGVSSPTVPVTVTVSPDAARFMSQKTPTTSVKASSVFSVTVDLRNVGTNTWTLAGGYGLEPVPGYYGWGITSVPLSGSDAIGQGQDKVFTFSCQAPATAGTYTMRWQMNHQGALFGDQSFVKTITVVP